MENSESREGEGDMHSPDAGADAGLDMPSALKVILNNGGRDVSSRARQVAKDAYLGFLLLRHLRIRDLRNTVMMKYPVVDPLPYATDVDFVLLTFYHMQQGVLFVLLTTFNMLFLPEHLPHAQNRIFSALMIITWQL